MEIRQLRYFITVAQTLNFSEAARKLYITQGTLSQQIQQLEYEMGSALFDRSPHHVSLTEAGDELLPLAIETINASEACLTRMNDLRQALAGTLRLGCIASFKDLMTSTIKDFIKANSHVSIELRFGSENELLEMLRKKEIDLALAYKSIVLHEDVESEVLFKTSLHVLMRRWHPLAEVKNLTLDALKGHGIIIPGKSMQARRSFDSFVGIDTRKLDIRLETNVPEVAMDIVQSTNLLAISTPLPASERDGLAIVPLENGKYSMSCCVHRLKDVYRKKSAELFIDLLRDSASFERMEKNLAK